MTEGVDPPVLLLDPPPFWAQDPVRSVLDRLDRAGLTLRLVGGCVRDAVRGISPASDRPDIDLATPDRPDRVMAAAADVGLKAVPTGLAHGTVTVVAGDCVLEITTLREDVETDGRHARVRFTDRWDADARRRDFTMNALYADADGRVFDPLGTGLDDARAGRVRFIGDPAARIAEDRLRVYRYFRFRAQIGTVEDADPAAVAAIRASVGELHRLAIERVWREVSRLLAAPDPMPAVRGMLAAGVASVALSDVGPATPGRLASLVARLPDRPDPVLRLAAFVSADPDALADRFRLSNAQRAALQTIAAGMAALTTQAGPPTEATVRALAARLGRPVGDAVALAFADAPIAGGDDPAVVLWRNAVAIGDEPPRRFPLTGRDALALGMPAGPSVGAALNAVEEWWLSQGTAPDADACRSRLAALAARDGDG